MSHMPTSKSCECDTLARSRRHGNRGNARHGLTDGAAFRPMPPGLMCYNSSATGRGGRPGDGDGLRTQALHQASQQAVAMTTPARRQYLDIKARHQDAILLYQIGDFYETFDEDAVLVARELQIVLTARAYGPDEQVPLAGVPVHALDTYAARLVAKGYTVAICEQVSPPGRGLVKREVTRILTPGTVADPAMLPAARDNLLAAVVCEGADGLSAAGLAYVDVATGAFACCAWPGPANDAALHAELRRLAPAEVLLREPRDAAEPGMADGAPVPAPGDSYRSTPCPASYFDPAIARAALTRHFGVPSLAAFGCEELPLAAAAAGRSEERRVG